MTIVTAFRATLEELGEATMLLHVVDLTSHNASEQCQTVEEILADFNLRDNPRITALNKIDLLLDNSKNWDEASALSYLARQRDAFDKNVVLVSSIKKWGLSKLVELISRTLGETTQKVSSDMPQ